MEERNIDNRVRHARRRPESVTQNRPASRTEGRDTRTSAGGRPSAGSGTGEKRGENYTFRAGTTRRNPGSVTSSRRVNAPVSIEQRSLTRAERHMIRAEEKEAAWQKDIVRTKGTIDWPMVCIIALLLALGSLTVFSASYPIAIAKGQSSTTYVVGQLQNLLYGIVVMLIAMFFPIRWIKKTGIVWGAFTVSAGVLVYAAVKGIAVGVTQRWINLGFITFQPSEIMKLAMVLALAWYLEHYEKKLRNTDGFWDTYSWNVVRPGMILAVACFLVAAGKHLSGTAIVGLIGLAMLMIGSRKPLWVMGTVAPLGIGGGLLFITLFPYALRRVTSFFDPNADITDEMYQTTQSIYAIGSGGLFGVGIGESRLKYSYLGNAHTDFIFSIWCEETGFVGAVALICLYLIFIWRGYLIAVRAEDRFQMLTAFGITTHVGIQAFLNMAVATKTMFNTGVTLPFFSYGGSALLMTMVEMGILLQISRYSYRKKEDLEREALQKSLGLD